MPPVSVSPYIQTESAFTFMSAFCFPNGFPARIHSCISSNAFSDSFSSVAGVSSKSSFCSGMLVSVGFEQEMSSNKGVSVKSFAMRFIVLSPFLFFE